MTEKIPHTIIRNYIFRQLRYRPKVSANLGFGFGI